MTCCIGARITNNNSMIHTTLLLAVRGRCSDCRPRHRFASVGGENWDSS